jgi:hypothetical protein
LWRAFEKLYGIQNLRMTPGSRIQRADAAASNVAGDLSATGWIRQLIRYFICAINKQKKTPQ